MEPSDSSFAVGPAASDEGGAALGPPAAEGATANGGGEGG